MLKKSVYGRSFRRFEICHFKKVRIIYLGAACFAPEEKAGTYDIPNAAFSQIMLEQINLTHLTLRMKSPLRPQKHQSFFELAQQLRNMHAQFTQQATLQIKEREDTLDTDLRLALRSLLIHSHRFFFTPKKASYLPLERTWRQKAACFVGGEAEMVSDSDEEQREELSSQPC